MNSLADIKQSFLNPLLLGIKPQKRLTVSEWSDQNRVLTTKSSAEPGKWRTSRTPYLKEIMDKLSDHDETQEVVVMKGAQLGLALALDEKIPTPDGWTTMGEIKIGDKVFDEKGNICNVTFKSEVFENHDCFEITFNDGTKIKCDADHRWTVWDEKKYEYRKLVTLKTSEIAKTFKVLRKKTRNRYAIEVSKPIKTKKKKLPIDPYHFGIWLGDGNLKQKSIPQEYLRASYKQRLELLRGLMDSDGSISNNRCEFSTVDEPLFKGVYELLMSLGIKASVYEAISNSGHFKDREKFERKSEPKTKWRISFTVFGTRVFNLKRKYEKQKQEGRISETKKRRIVNVEKINSIPTQCISVDSESHLYLCSNSFIATHNTECGNNWLGYIIDHSPAPTMMVLPTDGIVKKNSKIRIDPLLEETPSLRKKVMQKKSRDSGNTINLKQFIGGYLAIVGANSPTNLRSLPIRRVFFDEVDAFPGDSGGEGDPVNLAKKRANTFSRKKFFLVSTPVDESTSRIARQFEISDKRYYHVPCPHCNEYQKLEFTNLKWDKDKPETAAYFCAHCGEEIKEHNKSFMLARGKWIAEAESKIAGYHLNSLYSPMGWLSWQEIAEEWIDANKRKDRSKLKTFVNTILGETWKDKGEAPEWRRLYENREEYEINTIPDGVKFLTAAVDVQRDRLEVEIKGWGEDKNSWSIDYRTFVGDTSNTQDWCWQQVSGLLSNVWKKGQVQMGIQLMLIDSGYNTQTVYNFVRQFPPNRVRAIKGSDTLRLIYSQPKDVDLSYSGNKMRRALKLWTVGSSHIKSEIYGWLKQLKPTGNESFPVGYCHFPQYGEDFFKGLTAEEIQIKFIKGYRKYEWIKIRERNEPLDLMVYNRAAASMIGIDRFSDGDWREVEKQVAQPIELGKNETKTVKKARKPRKKSDFW